MGSVKNSLFWKYIKPKDPMKEVETHDKYSSSIEFYFLL